MHFVLNEVTNKKNRLPPALPLAVFTRGLRAPGHCLLPTCIAPTLPLSHLFLSRFLLLFYFLLLLLQTFLLLLLLLLLFHHTMVFSVSGAETEHRQTRALSHTTKQSLWRRAALRRGCGRTQSLDFPPAGVPQWSAIPALRAWPRVTYELRDVEVA